MSSFTDALLVTPLPDGKSWVIMSLFRYSVGQVESADVIHVTKGFVTDFASVPRIFWWFIPRWGVYGNATVIHDWLYWEQIRTRKESDDILLEAMKVLKVPKIKCFLIYWSVKLFGSWAWKRNGWDKNSGFNRIIPDFKITYSTFLNRPGIIKRTIEQIKIP